MGVGLFRHHAARRQALLAERVAKSVAVVEDPAPAPPPPAPHQVQVNNRHEHNKHNRR